MSDQRTILDTSNFRNTGAAPLPVLPSALAIQNVNNTLSQVDDLGNVTPLIGGTIGGITAITGDVVATGPGVVNSVIQPKKVTYAKIQDVGANSFLGNPTGHRRASRRSAQAPQRRCSVSRPSRRAGAPPT